MDHWIRPCTTMRPSSQFTSVARVCPPFRSLSTTYPVIRSVSSLSVFVYYVSSHTSCFPISVRHASYDLRLPHIQSSFTSVAQSVFGLPISVCHVSSHTICFTRSKRMRMSYSMIRMSHIMYLESHLRRLEYSTSACLLYTSPSPRD